MYNDGSKPPGIPGSPLSFDEKKRLEVLKAYNILDSSSEEEFDRLTELISVICETPMAAISIVAENRQWFKSKFGISLTETPLEISMCKYAIKQNGLYEVEDAILAEEFKNNPLVTNAPGIRYYAGFPLIDPYGFPLGTLCVMDTKPRKLNDNQRFALSVLAKQIVSKIIYRKELEYKKYFEELFLRSIDMVCIAGIDGFFKMVNPAFTTTLGWSRQEMLDKPFIEFVHPDDKSKTVVEMSKISHGHSTINFRNRYRMKSGEYKVLGWVSTPNIESGIIYAIAHDLTEIMEYESQLQSAEKKFRELFENSPDAIFLEDASGNIIDVNNAALEMQGLTKEELVGTNFRNLVPKEKYVRILTDYKKLFYGIYNTVESVVWSKSRGEIPVEISGKKIIYDNKAVLLLLIRDITERKKIESERTKVIHEKNRIREEQIAQTFKILEEERSRIAMEMHDDVGTGLSSISILSNVIKKSTKDPLLILKNIDKILLSSKNVQESISEIIWAINPKNDTLENLIAYLNFYCLENFGSGSIKLNLLLPEYVPSQMVDGVFRRNIFLVIKEAINNIGKYSECNIVNIRFIIENRNFIISIEDDGKGFTIDKVSRFSNGINNMKKRINSIGGNFMIHSQPGKGTTINVEVPIRHLKALL
jgi:PAS domain S-box-containing protein